MQFDFSSEVPLYQQVAEEIEDAILSGAFEEETQVPSTTEISTTYRINPATVLKGMTQLTQEGILYKKRGVGMFVSPGAGARILHPPPPPPHEGYVVKLLEEARKLGMSRQEVIELIKGGSQDEQRN